MQKKRFWYLIGIGVIILFFFIFVSNVMSVGLKLREIHEYIEYGFYGLSVILVYVLIIYPLKVILFAPTFSIDALLDDSKKYRLYKDAAKVLLITENIKDKEKLKEALATIFNTTIKEEMNKLIIKNSETVLVSTALSQNGNLDMLSVIAINLKMIKEIVQLSGFRPTYPNLAKLSLNVLITSIIAEGIDDLEVSELLPSKISETMTDFPFVKTISSSILSGIANGMLTCRVGVVTRTYLFRDNKLLDKKQIRRMAYKETIKMMPLIVAGGLSIFPKGVAAVFGKPFKKRAKKAESKE